MFKPFCLAAGVAAALLLGASPSLSEKKGYSPSQAFNGNGGYQTGENPFKVGGGAAYPRCKRIANGRCVR